MSLSLARKRAMFPSCNIQNVTAKAQPRCPTNLVFAKKLLMACKVTATY
jgi:hypothetical protein